MTSATASTGTPLSGTQRDWLKAMKSALNSPATVGAAPVGAGAGPLDLALQWGPEIIALAKQLGARRKCLVAVVNATEDRVIFRGDAKFKSGGFASIPKADKIEPKNGKLEFIAASPENNPFGSVEGEVPFAIDGETDWHVRFSNPRAGSVEASNNIDDTAAASKFFADAPVKGNGDTAEIRFTLRGGGGSTPPNPNPNPLPQPSGVDVPSSCLITITNNSKAVLNLLDPKQEVGNFMTPVPNSIAAGGTASLVYVETPKNTNPKDEGCKGGVLWGVGSPQVCTCLMEWNNPEGTQNTVNVTFNPPDGAGFRCVKQIGQGEENVPVSFTFIGDGGGPVPPPTSSSKLKFTVVDGDSNQPLVGAAIQVEQQSAKSDKAGKAEISVAAGSHAFHVTADGFDPNDGNAAAKDGEDTDVSVAMRKGQPKPDFKEPVESKQPTLRPGDDNPDGWVEFMQSLLIKQLGDSIKQNIDGKFDKQTELNVRKFQHDHKPKALQIDGVVGNQTWAALRKAPEEKVGTDGRKPHTFVEQGPEARWVCEQTNFEIKIDPVKDTVTLSLASVGTEPVDKFQATVFVTPAGGTKTQLPPITIGPPTAKRDSGSGDIHQVVLRDFAKTFGTGTHTITAFLPQELGGDKFEDKVPINKPGATGGVVVTVTNKTTGKPIANATVDINGAKDQTTDLGLVNLDGIKAGTQPFKVTAKGFQDESGTVDIPGDDNAPAATLRVAMKPAQGPGPQPNKIGYEPGEREASFTSPGGAETTNSGFVLFNFGVNQDTLKPEHQKFLLAQIKTLQMDQANPQKFVSIIAGFTDDVDDEAKNAPLRDKRAAAVQKFLLDNGVAPESAGVIRKTPKGQFLAKNTTRDGRSRNRAVTIDLASDIVPPIPDPPKPQTAKATKWALQSNLSASIPTKPGVAISTVNFILINRETNKKFLLQFAGFGAGFGLSFPASVAIPAPTNFETLEAVDETAFNGGGEIHQVSVGVGVIGFSEGEATLHPQTKPKQIDISGFQFSFGADASFVGGQWRIIG